MKRIHFKNGSHLDVTQEIIEIINSRLESGCNDFQMFQLDGKTEYIINIKEIVFITKVP